MMAVYSSIFTSLLHRIFFLITVVTLVRADDDEDAPGLRGTLAERNRAHMAHGVVISLAVVVFLPIGAILVRAINSPRIIEYHAIFQMFSFAVLLTGFALGVWLSYLHNEVR
jgi:hypothetical protein